MSCLMAVAVAPNALAADAAGTVTSSRSFPKAQTVRKDLLAEATSTSVNDDANWGSTENLNVPQTQSQAEKDAAAAKKAEEEAAKKAAEEEAAAQAAAAAAQAAAASRSEERESISTDTTGTSSDTASADSSTSSSSSSTSASTSNASADAIVAYATQFVGAPYVAGGNTPSGWDCSGFVQYVFAQFGISLPRTSGAQAAVGTAVASIADAKPGDIVANADHAAIYIGNGLVINALNPYQGTQITGLDSFYSAYSIRRVL